jgi:hypothetical protein
LEHSFYLQKWRSIGWRDPFWEIVRFYCSLRGNEQKEFLLELQEKKTSGSKWWELLALSDKVASDVASYIKERNRLLAHALDCLRTEEEAMDFCTKSTIEWKVTKTKSKDHHQSSKTLIATVSSIADQVCSKYGVTLDSDPQRRCIWYIDNKLHITARNLDGAIPALKDPYIVWEIKEYWGKTKGGSKMSDAVYECHLVGRELRDYEERSGHKVSHIVFLDGKEQWNARKSDLARFIDLHNQGLIDYLFIGKTIETEWKTNLEILLTNR